MYIFLHLGLGMVVMTWKLKISAAGLGKLLTMKHLNKQLL